MNVCLKAFCTRSLVVFCAVALIAANLFFGDVFARQAVAQTEQPLGGRTMTVVSTTGEAGGQVVVTVDLDAQGDEVSTSFTLLFDPAILTNPVVALGSGVPTGSNLSINPNQVGAGRLGLLIDSTNLYTVSPPNRQVVNITFSIAANAPTGATPISFVSSPTPLSVSSAVGSLLPTVYQVGTVTVTAPAVQFVTVGGRVTTPTGQNLRNTTVNMIDSNGVRRVATTSSFGLYSFANVATGQSYTFTVTSKRYRFSPQVINVTGAISNLDFVGLE